MQSISVALVLWEGGAALLQERLLGTLRGALPWLLRANQHRPHYGKSLMGRSAISLPISPNTIPFYLADVFIQSDVQNGAYQGHITNNWTSHIRYNSSWIGCSVMNICPVHKGDRPRQTTITRQLQLAELQQWETFKSLKLRYKIQGAKATG